MQYKLYYRRGWFWKSVTVIGHKFQQDYNRMDCFLPDGSIFSVGNWDKYDLRLKTDWVLATKKQMEKESGQDIKLTVD